MPVQIISGLQINALGPGINQISISPGIVYDGTTLYGLDKIHYLNVPNNPTNMPRLASIWASPNATIQINIEDQIDAKVSATGIDITPTTFLTAEGETYHPVGPRAFPSNTPINLPVSFSSESEGQTYHPVGSRAFSSFPFKSLTFREGGNLAIPSNFFASKSLSFTRPHSAIVSGMHFEIELGDSTWTDDPSFPQQNGKLFLGVLYLPNSYSGTSSGYRHSPISYSNGDQTYPLNNISPLTFKKELAGSINDWIPHRTYLYGQVVRNLNVLAWASRTHVSSDNMMSDIQKGNLTLFNVPLAPGDDRFSVTTVAQSSGVDGSIQYNGDGGVQKGSLNMIWDEILNNLLISGVLTLDLSPNIPNAEAGKIHVYTTQEEMDGQDYLILNAKLPDNTNTALATIPIP